MPRKQLLLVSYLFPPVGGVGVQRALSLVRYLPESGYDTTVLTAKNASAPTYDPKLLSLVPSGVRVVKTITPELPFSWRDRIVTKMSGGGKTVNASSTGARPQSPLQPLLSKVRGVVERALTPDPQVGWVRFALPHARRIVREQAIDTVLVTAPPFSSLRIGVELKREFPSLTLVSDFRDEWLGHFIALDRGASEYRAQVARELEADTIHRSDLVVSVTPPWVRNIRERYPAEPDDKFVCIPNGFDPEVFAGFTPRPHGQPKLVITYSGSVYDNPVYSPRAYLQALDSLPAEMKASIETRFIGRVAREAAPLLESRAATVRPFGFMAQQDAFRMLEETDCLLMIFSTPTGHSGKLFEYLATGKPILALSPRGGEIDRILGETRAGWCVEAHDAAEIAAALRGIYDMWRNGGAVTTHPDRQAVERYSRRNLVASFADAMAQAGHAALERTV